MREGKTITRTGRGITTIVALVLLFGTLLPLFGSTAQASEANDFASDKSIESSLFDSPHINR